MEAEPMSQMEGRKRFVPLALLSLSYLCACVPRVEVTPSDKPITINLNVKIEHEVRVKIDKELEDQVFGKDSKLF